MYLRLADMEPLDGLDPDYFAEELVFIDRDHLPPKENFLEELNRNCSKGSSSSWSNYKFRLLTKTEDLSLHRKVIRALWNPKHAKLVMLLLKAMQQVRPECC